MYGVNVGFVVQLLNVLEGEGLDSAALCRQVGIDGDLLGRAEGFVPREPVHRLMALAGEVSGNPGIGLRAGRHFLPGGLQLVGYTMMSSANLGQALESLVRFSPLLGSGFSMGLSREADGQRLWALDHMGKPRPYEDAGIAVMLGFCRWLTAGNLPCPREVEFTYPEPAETDEHRQLFGCALRFGALRNSILFDHTSLAQPLSTANEALALLHGRFAEHRIEQLQGTSHQQRVRTLLIERLDRGVCDMDAVAASLGIGKRTLQRGLLSEGVHFTEVLDGARRQLADHYLRHSCYTLARIGELLGFREPSSFHKACRRWFGMPPGRYRSQRKSR